MNPKMLLIVLCCLSAMSGLAQFSSNIQGTVQDQSGAVIPAATVTLVNLNTEVTQTAKSTDAGYYRFVSLPPAPYEVRAEASGFRTTKASVILRTAQTMDVPFTLEVSTQQAKVEVTATPPAVDVADSRMQASLEEEQLHDLPLQGRNFLGLAALAPGVTGLGGVAGGGPGDAPDNFGTEKGVDVRSNGRTYMSNLYSVDGLAVTSNIRPGILNMGPNPDSIQEVAIQTNTFAVDHGRSSSVVVTMTTKSGSNEFHGTGNYQYTDQHLWARRVFMPGGYNPFRKHVLDATFGGPIVKNKTFFFTSLETLRSTNSLGGSVRTFESQDFINWAKTNFPNSLGTGLLTKYPVTGAVVTGVARTARDIFGLACGTSATSNIPCNLAMINTGEYTPSPFRNGLQWSFRGDQYLNNSKDRIYGNFYRTTLDTENPTIRAGLKSTNTFNTNLLQINESHTFSPTVVNEASFGSSRVEGIDILPLAPTVMVPKVTVVGQGTGIGTDAWGPGTFIQHNYNWRDVLNMVRASHSFKFGVEGWFGDDNALQSPTWGRPGFTFNNLLDLVRDKPYRENAGSFDPLSGKKVRGDYLYKSKMWGFFVQDEWKMRPNLTLTLGLRWDDYGNPYPGRIASGETSILSNIFLGAGATMDARVTEASARKVNHVFVDTPRAFSPRIGVAWDPEHTGRWVIRGGFGIYHDWYTLGQAENSLVGNPPGFIFPTFLAGQPPEPLFTVGTTAEYPYGYQFPDTPPRQLDQHGGYSGILIPVNGVDPRMPPSYSANYLIGVEHRLPGDFVVGANYSGSHGWDLPLGSEFTGPNLNRFAGDLVDGRLDRLNSSFGAINYVYAGNVSNYNAMVLTFRRRMGARGTFQGSYTLSHATDYGNNWPDQHFIADRADTDFDARHHFSFSGVFRLPSLRGAPLPLRKVIGDWELANTIMLQAGTPYTVYTSSSFQPIRDAQGNVIGLKPGSGDYNADGYNYDFPNSPAKDFTGSYSRRAYMTGLFTAADFPVPAIGKEGNLKRNLFRNPGFAAMDAGFIKNNPLRFLGERGNLQIRVEFFNLLNRVNLTGVNSDLTSSVFGRSTGVFNPRITQLGARVEF